MRVTLEIMGGLAAAIRRRPLSVDLAGLPAAERERLATLFAEASGSDTAASPDAMTYRITLADDGGSRVLKASDSSGSPAFHDLVQWIREHAAP